MNIGSDNKNGMEEFSQTVMDLVQSNVSWNSQIISAEAYKIKADIRKLFEEEKTPHITRDMFNKIAAKNKVKAKRAEEILKDLHALGVCLWYDKDEMGEFNTLVLNPDWITAGIYRIINKGHNEQPLSINVDYGVLKLKEIEKY